MGARGYPAFHEAVAGAAPHLPMPDRLGAAELAAPYRISEIAFVILVHQSLPSHRNFWARAAKSARARFKTPLEDGDSTLFAQACMQDPQQ